MSEIEKLLEEKEKNENEKLDETYQSETYLEGHTLDKNGRVVCLMNKSFDCKKCQEEGESFSDKERGN